MPQKSNRSQRTARTKNPKPELEEEPSPMKELSLKEWNDSTADEQLKRYKMFLAKLHGTTKVLKKREGLQEADLMMLDPPKPEPPPFCCFGSVVHPDAVMKGRWDLLMLVLIVYVVIVVPYRMAFSADATGTLKYIEMFMDFFFITDCILNFNTAFWYNHQGNKEDVRLATGRGAITKHYMSSWFWIDAPSSVPVDFILEFCVPAQGAGDDSAKGLKILRFLRLFRLFRVVKLLKLEVLFDILETKFRINLNAMRIFKMLLTMVAIGHFLGCIFGAIWNVEMDPSGGWIGSFDGEVGGCTNTCRDPFTGLKSTRNGICEDGGAETTAEPICDYGTDCHDCGPRHDVDAYNMKYLYGLYWAMTTMTTVGYGDTLPTTNQERVFCIITFMIGGCVFGFMLGNITGLMNDLYRVANMYQENVDTLKEYMRSRQFPPDLNVKLLSYYQYYWKARTVFDEASIIGQIAPPLQEKVVVFLSSTLLNGLSIITDQQSDFIAAVIKVLLPTEFGPHLKITRRGCMARAVYFVKNGEVAILSEHLTVLDTLGSGTYFGEEGVLGTPNKFTIESITALETIALTTASLRDVFKIYPVVRENIVFDMKFKSSNILKRKEIIERSEMNNSPQDFAAWKIGSMWRKRAALTSATEEEEDSGGLDVRSKLKQLMSQLDGISDRLRKQDSRIETMEILAAKRKRR